ncbi:MAG: PepSY domain-containing protein [Rhodobacteraceae bacterium]|nr:PepSY domain-containing protein [Paracoccaceae bacterium]
MKKTTENLLPSNGLYRAVWRWHFYAGLLVLPFLILLAVTGGIYLFKDEINNTAYRSLRIVEPQDTTYEPPSLIVANALAYDGGTLKAYFPPAAPDKAAQVRVSGEDGLKNTVFVNPYTAEVLGSQWDSGASGSPAMWVVRKLHSLEYIGWIGNRIIEGVAGWLVLLVGTGLYLWWPRNRRAGVLTVKARKGRPWWRDVHAVTGFYTAGFILFLSLTGLPWSGVWGKQFYELSYKVGLGMPDGYWSSYPVSNVPTGEVLDRTPWILEHQPLPLSTASKGIPAGLDQVVAKVEELGVAAGYTLNMPSGPTGVFTASVYPDDITQERVVHLDQYTGEVLFDMGLSDLGTLGFLAEWGVSIHMGQAFGTANQIVLLLACAAMVLMAVSAAVMWWRRRPAGKLAAPTYPADLRVPPAIWIIAVLSGVFFPLVGLSMLVFIAIEFCLHGVARLRTA